MNKHSTIMTWLLRGFPRFYFQSIVNEYFGDKKVRTLSSDHMLTAMLYGQISSVFGMQEIMKALEANRNKLNNAGLGEVKRSTPTAALEKRHKQIFERFFVLHVGQGAPAFQQDPKEVPQPAEDHRFYHD